MYISIIYARTSTHNREHSQTIRAGHAASFFSRMTNPVITITPKTRLDRDIRMLPGRPKQRRFQTVGFRRMHREIHCFLRHAVQIEANPKPRTGPSHRSVLCSPPQNDSRRDQQTQQQARPANDQFPRCGQGRHRLRNWYQPEMQLMDVPNPSLGSGRLNRLSAIQFMLGISPY